MASTILNHELTKVDDIKHRLDRVRAHLTKNEFPALDDVSAWFSYLAVLKSIQGNFNNDVSFLATLMAKKYLEQKFGLQHFDAAQKPQGAPGLDIDVYLPNGQRIIAEIKTTTPFKSNDLGAQQKAMFTKDFNKLADTDADVKIFFLTERVTFELMKKPKYSSQLVGVVIVLLPDGEEFFA